MMRSIFGFLISPLFVLFVVWPQAWAQLNSYSRSELAFDNALSGSNPGFESGTVKWTASGGTFAVNSGTQFVPGSKQFASWDSNSASQEVCSSLVKVPESGNCSVGLEYRVPSGTATHKIVAKDGSKDLAIEDVVSSTSAMRHEVEFPCAAAASNQARVCLRSVASNEPAIQFDSGYAGYARNVGVADLTTAVTAYSPTFNSTTGHSASNGWWYKDGDRIVVGGSILWNGTGAASTFSVTVPSNCTIDLAKLNDSASYASLRNSAGYWSWYDDAGSAAVNPQWVRVTSSTTLNFVDGSNSVISNIFANNDRISWRAEFPCVGWTASTVVTPDAQGWWAAGNISGANPSLGTSAVTAYTEITNGSLTLTPMSGSAPVGVMCSSTNAAATPSTGASTCSAGNESVGFNVNVPRSGTYEVCFNASNDIGASSGNGAFVTLQTVRTATNAQTILAEGGARTQGGSQGMTISGGTNSITSSPHKNCGIFNLSAGVNGFRLMYEQSIQGSGPSTSVIAADGSTSAGQRDVFFYMKPVTGQQQAILANSVWTGATQMRIETVTIQNNGSACSTLGNLSSNWVGVYTRNGAGRCQFTMPSGVWSSTPTCQCTVQSTNAVSSCSVDSNITLSSTLMAFQSSAGGSAADSTMRVMCMEPR